MTFRLLLAAIGLSLVTGACANRSEGLTAYQDDQQTSWTKPDRYWTEYVRHRPASAPSQGRIYYASPTGSDQNSGDQSSPWRTLQRAAATMGPGDTLLIADGEYPGGVRQRVSGAPGRPITYRAINAGKAIVNGDEAGPDFQGNRRPGGGLQRPGGGQQRPGGGQHRRGGQRDRGRVRPGARHGQPVSFEPSAEATGSARSASTLGAQHSTPGAPAAQGAGGSRVRKAIWVRLCDYVVIDGLTVRNARTGIHVDQSNHVTVRYCRTVENKVTGIFTSYADDLLLEYNECAYSGEQHGIYVSNSGDRPIVRNNSCHNNARAGVQLNGDAKQRKREFGTRGDGIIDGAVLEGNVLYENGKMGAAAYNLACVHNGRIVNNLIFNNRAGGIALFNDHRRTLVEFGSKNNRIVHNTIKFRPGEGRSCVSLKHGSTDNVFRNNILQGGGRAGAYEFDGVSSFTSENNLFWNPSAGVVATDEDKNQRWNAAEWKKLGKNDQHSVWADPQLDRDFRPLPSSPAAGRAEDAGVLTDLFGKARPGRKSIGALEPAR